MNPEGLSIIRWDAPREMWRVDVAPYGPVWTESEAVAELVAIRLEPKRAITRR